MVLAPKILGFDICSLYMFCVFSPISFFLAQKIFSKMSLDLILKINFFFILFDGIFAFLKNVYREGVKISKNFSWSCWANLLKIFSSSLLRRIFQKWPSPLPKSGQLKSENFYFYFHHPCPESDFFQKPVLKIVQKTSPYQWIIILKSTGK